MSEVERLKQALEESESRHQALMESVEARKRSDLLKSQFFANLSHELRTPLALCISPLEMLLHDEQLAPLHKQTLHSINNNQLRLLKLINEVMDFAKLQAGGVVPNFSCSDVVNTLRRYSDALETAASHKGIVLNLKVPDHPINLYLDQNLFEKIIMTLLSNAFKFTEEGGTIELRVQDLEEEVRISVSDTGIGMVPEIQNHLFDRFSHVESFDTQTHPGSGMGLAMTKEYVDMHGGTIKVHSQLGLGSIFHVTFLQGKAHLNSELISEEGESSAGQLQDYQLVEFKSDDNWEPEEEEVPVLEEAQEVGESPLPESGEPEVALENKPTILIVDDNADMRRFLHSLLRPHYQTYLAKDGLEGLEKAQTLFPDLILSDTIMPWVNGYELCQAIKASGGRLKHTPFVLMTAKAETKMKLEGLEYGADDYLVKPFNVDELIIRVKNLIKIRQQGMELYQTMQALEEKKNELEKSLSELKLTQSQLVQSEKMAGLGQLVAGIAHEVNTPAAVIYSAISEVDQDYVSQLEQLIQIMGSLPQELHPVYRDACFHVLEAGGEISTKDQRAIAKGIREQLDPHGVTDTRALSKDLALVGFKAEHVSQVIPLFLTPEAKTIRRALRQLGMSRIRVKDIHIAIGRITQLVKALKHHSRSDAAELLETDLQEDLENTLVILHHKIKRAIHVHKEYDPIPSVKCYANQLNQVWTNLIHNAIQAMKGDGDLILRLKRESEEYVVVEIQDNGPGIPEKIVSLIFDPYFTTKPKGEGTGLGLSICKEIVDRHNGAITLTSNPGNTCFRIVLPIEL